MNFEKEVEVSSSPAKQKLHLKKLESLALSWSAVSEVQIGGLMESTDEKWSKSYCSQDVCQVQHKPTQIYHECDKNSRYTGPMRIITIPTPVYCTLNHFF